ncbi:MAG: insulinase family protein [Deltaproteobacteria bacterium]|nr:insulinase family protein [Deltaproteobacteria bacterium]
MTPPLTAELVGRLEAPLPVERYRFSNGLTLLYHPDHGAPLLSYQTWVPVGSAAEREGETGVAHLFEHLMFKATRARPEGELDRALEQIGASANAATWLDWTYYYEDAPSAHLELIADLEADRLGGLLLSPEQLEAERKVVMNERRECVEDDPDGLMDERLWRLAFGEGPYGHPTIGWMDDIAHLTLAGCEAFYRAHYAPNRVVLVVCGDVERERLLRVIGEAYAHLAPQPPPPPVEHAPPPLAGPRREALSLTLHAPRLSVGFVAPPVTAPESLALECLDELLNQGDSARLHRALVLEREWATGVYSATPSFQGHGLYELTAELIPGADPDAALAVLLDALRAVAEEGLAPGELDKVKRQRELGAYRGLQTLQQRAQLLGFWEVVSGDCADGLRRVDALLAVTEGEVRAAAAALLDPARRVVVVGVPDESNPDDPDDLDESDDLNESDDLDDSDDLDESLD